MYKTILLLLSLLLTTCDKASITGPQSSPSATPPPVEVAAPIVEPIDPGIPFSYDNARGVLLFAGTQGSEGEILTLINSFNSAWGGKQLVFNTCSETSEWEMTPWADGPPALSKENLENLSRFLSVTAKMATMVRLNIFCTMRDNKGWMDANWKEYTLKVVDIVKDFDHVFLSIANEPYHKNSWFKGSVSRLRKVRDTVRMAGFQGQLGTDDTIECSGCSTVYAYGSLGFTPDFHPFRNPDPGSGDFKWMVQENGLPIVISEPTAYSKWLKGKCCTSNQQQVISYFRRAERQGIVMFYHSTSGLNWPREKFEWIPQL